MSIKNLFATICASALLCCSVSVFAQTGEDAANAYNKGIELIQSDINGAITAVEQALSIAETVGEEAKPIADNAKAALPGLYKQAADKLVQGQKLTEAVAAYEKASEIAAKYGDETIASAIEKTLPQVQFGIARQAIVAKNYDEAISILDKVIASDADNLDAIFLKGEAFRASGKADDAVAVFDDLIAKATAASDNENLDKAKKSAANALFSKAQALTKEKKNADALKTLEQVLTYDENHLNSLQTLISLYSAAKNNDKVISTATKFLEVKGGDPKANANIYYYLGASYIAKQNTAKACEAFKNAQYSTNAQIAAYVKQVLATCK